jgi:glyoxylase-like metal-dependent hydrolase (beta-lactamase superfamily II)
MFEPHSGRLQTSLREAGIDPGSIAAVVCSHPPDHIGGICTDDGVPPFPNAQIYQSENDFNFWTNKELLGTRLDLWVKIARNNLLPVRERIVFFKDGQEFLPGVQAMFTPGHAKEHAYFIMTSGNESMFLIGDLSHLPVLFLERPRNEFIYDLDPLQAAETRVKVVGMLSKVRMTVLRRSLSMAWRRPCRRRERRISIFSGSYQVGFQIVSCSCNAVATKGLFQSSLPDVYGDPEV